MVNPFTAAGGAISKGGGGNSRAPSGKNSGKGNSSFQEALKRGSAYAWKGRWEDAVEEYRHALEFSPGDLSARTYLAMALYKADHLQEARQLYQELWREQPSNLSMLLRLAEVQETMGDINAAVASYQGLAELHTLRRAPNEALKAWQKAVALKPDDLVLWDATMEAAVQAGMISGLMPSYLGLARQLALEGRFEEAIAVVARAQTLDPSNPLVLPLLASIRGALAHSWRATARGETTTPDDLARLIPTIPDLGSSISETADTEPSAPLPSSDVDALTEVHDSSTAAPVVELTEPFQHELRAEEFAPAVEDASAPEPEPCEDASAARPLESLGELSTLVEGDLEKFPPSVVEPSEDLPSLDKEPLSLVEEPPIEVASSLLQEFTTDETTSEDAAPTVEGEAPSNLLPGEESSEAVPAEEQLEALTLDGEIEVAEPELEEAPSAEHSPSQVELTEGEASQVTVDLSLPSERAVEAFDEGTDGDVDEEGSSGNAIAEQLAELAEAHEQVEEFEQAAEAYGQALELSPRLPRALLGMARLQLATGELDLAEERVRLVLEASSPEMTPSQGLAVKLLLDILIGRAVSGDLQAATEGLLWLRSILPAERLQSPDVEDSAEVIAQLLGRCGAEHLEELASLQPERRGEVVLTLRKAEELLESGRFRSAADESFRLIAHYPDLLPAQSLLARLLVAQKRAKDARERSQRLLNLYEMRGAPQQALEVLQWRVSSGVGDGADRVRLVQLLRAQNRLAEADLVEMGRDRESSTRRSIIGTPPLEELLHLAEASFASGDREGAVGLLRAALEAEETDEVARAALARVLQLMGDESGRGELLETLSRLGLPAGLAD